MAQWPGLGWTQQPGVGAGLGPGRPQQGEPGATLSPPQQSSEEAEEAASGFFGEDVYLLLTK